MVQPTRGTADNLKGTDPARFMAPTGMKGKPSVTQVTHRTVNFTDSSDTSTASASSSGVTIPRTKSGEKTKNVAPGSKSKSRAADHKSSTSSSDDWAFPERPFDRLNPKQQRRRHKEILQNKNRVDTRTRAQLKDHRFGITYMKLMRPMYLILFGLGRFPFDWKDNLDGTFYFSGGWEKARALWFNFIVWLITFSLGSSIYNSLGIVLNLGPYGLTEAQTRTIRIRERVMIYRYVNIYFSIMGGLIHNFFTSGCMYFKSDIILRYLSYWTEALQRLKIDPTPGLFEFRNQVLISYSLFMILMILLSVFRLTGSAAGGPTIMGYVMFRMTKSDFLLDGDGYDGTHYNPWWIVIQAVGGVIFFMTLIWSKIYIFFFMLKAKALRNALATWNGRLYSAILRGGPDSRLESGRTTLALLFRDHGTLLDLLESSDEFFGVIIESYMFTQLWSICFENYFLIKSIRYGFRYSLDFYRRGFEFATAFLACGHNWVILYNMLMIGTELGEEAMAGFEVIRRRTVMGLADDEEYIFTLSMYASYAGHRQLKVQASGYFYFSRTVMASIFSSIAVFSVIIFQFQPNFDYRVALDRDQGGYWMRIIEPITNPFMCKSWHLDELAYKECFRTLERDGFNVSHLYLNDPKLHEPEYDL